MKKIITETQLRAIVKESVQKILKEGHMEINFEELKKYFVEGVEDFKIRLEAATDKVWEHHTSIAYEDSSLIDDCCDMIEEYFADNDIDATLSDFFDEYDIEEVLLNMLD